MVNTFARIFAAALFLPFLAVAQTADSRKSATGSGRDRPERTGTLIEQATRGEIPFAFADERLKPDPGRIRRLAPASPVLEPNELGRPLQIGVTREVEPSLRAPNDSAMFDVEGGRVFLLGIVSPGAKSIRVRFSQTDLPAGGRIFVFPLGSKDQYFGPFDKTTPLANGTFWSPPVPGEAIAIELFVPTRFLRASRDYVRVIEVAHNFEGIGQLVLNPALPCHNDIGTGYANMAAAVSYLEFVDPAPPCGGVCICTGTLLNAASVSFAPYLLTANHCIHSESVAQSVAAYWLYNTGDSPPIGTSFTSGGTVLSTSTQSDFALLRLTGTVPGGLTYSGWEGGNGPSPNTLLAGIHHPMGSHKRVNFGFANATGAYCPPAPYSCNNFLSVTWSSGLTEGGSSGSGLFYTASNGGRLVGQLYGLGVGTQQPACSGTNISVYGRFGLTYNKISSYIADAVCTYSISSNSGSFGQSGGNGSFDVTTNGSCYQSPVVTLPNTIQTFSNVSNISVADRSSNSAPPGVANLYPSTINVAGVSGTITRVRVKLNNLTHTFPDDLDLLLVGPNGTQVVLMSDAGDGVAVSNSNLTIDQSGANLLPDTSGFSSGTFRPSNYAGSPTIDLAGTDDFPAPAPGQTAFDSSLEFFYGTNPNGTWKLYVVDDEAQDVGGISGGWSLELATTGSSWLTVTSGTGYGNNTVNYTVAPNPPGQPARTGAITVSGQTHNVFQNAGATVGNRPSFDFDGDGKADVAVFRGSVGDWYRLNSSNNAFVGQHFGQNGDRSVGADFDGDGKTDLAIFRPSAGAWYWINSGNNTLSGVAFGQNGDLPVPADYDGDGKADLCVFRPSTAAWYRINSSTNQFVAVAFGVSTDKPAVGDFDGDGKADISVFRPSVGDWYRLNSSTGQFAGLHFGANGDKAVPADYDGDGKADIAVFRSSTGDWYGINSGNGTGFGIHFGANGDLPSPADFDGDNKADYAVFRPSTGAWYLQRTTAGFGAQAFGTNGDTPVPNSFVY